MKIQNTDITINMKIGLLGSFFDPPHLGHILVAQMVLDLGGCDKLWWLIGNKSTLGKKPTDFRHRLQMIKRVKMPETCLSTLEIDHQLDGNTVNLVPILKYKYPKDRFVFVVGSDQLSDFHKWGRYKELIKLMEFLVVPRAGYACEPLYSNMTVLKHKNLVLTNISSSTVRERVKNNLSIDNFVPEDVKEYIEKHKLYK